MKTDGELLLGLLTGDCCECECPAPLPVPADSSPRHPQMLGKKMPPLTVLDTDAPFVPLLLPERETGQVPQPGHQPMISDSGGYADAGVLAEEQYGFNTGIMLDSGTVTFANIRQIDHQTRTYRSYVGAFSATDDLRPAGTMPTDNPPKYILTAQTTAFIDNLKAGGDPDYFFSADIAMDYTRVRTYSEDAGGTFAGAAVPVLPISNVLDSTTTLTVTKRRASPFLEPQVAFYPPLLPIAIPQPPEPVYTVRSPLVNGRSFQLNSLRASGVDPLIIEVGGSVLPGSYGGIAAFQDSGGITLLLSRRSDDTVTLIPGLDLTKLVTASMRALLIDMGQPEFAALGLRADLQQGHHSFPTDRGYVAVSRTVAEATRFIGIGSWDAYRDVPADLWRAAGLSKPRTRRAFEAGKLASQPAALPPPPLYGLATLDVYGARADGEAQHSPVSWRSVRGEPLFRPPLQVEVWDGAAWQVSQAALLALSKPYGAGQEDDRTFAGGRLRLTLHADGLLVFVGRARGDLTRLSVNGQPAAAAWLGLDAGHGPGWPARQPKGWHPFTLRVTGGATVELDTQGLKLSALNLRSVTGIR